LAGVCSCWFRNPAPERPALLLPILHAPLGQFNASDFVLGLGRLALRVKTAKELAKVRDQASGPSVNTVAQYSLYRFKWRLAHS